MADDLAAVRAHLLDIKAEYFEQDEWYNALCRVGLEHLTFQSQFIDISPEEANALLSGSEEGLQSLTKKIDEAQSRLGAKRIFVKFVRSPKDAATVYTTATAGLAELLKTEKTAGIWQLFGVARQEGLGISSAEDAVRLLRSSGRVCAAQGSDEAPEGGDIWWTVNSVKFGEEFSFENMRPRLMVRTFDGALPLESEWRAFIWKRKCTGISQYFYDFSFESLQPSEVKTKLVSAVEKLMEELEPMWDHMPQDSAMMDFAWDPDSGNDITIIEVNPFDPAKSLGTTSSLALFDWKKDGEQLRNGTDIEVRTTPIRNVAEVVKEFNAKAWPAVGNPAREALRQALRTLSYEELVSTHALTQDVARLLGVDRELKRKSMTKGQGKGAKVGRPPVDQGKGTTKGKGKTTANAD
eukprot:gnl/TRDRNA2_/TRDRNA2_44543_c0_seq1.p1 gnl/TRDRNA2_/TRDRNA2_44543_c0~~gnl/TRDRNA2_/TRDRNA2_44543_c0_seq1.p1  ORF type:complete len:409 (-),score=69.62 gnl/TRDRNA2_/TRDRNA2_44543_c0_seq1:350-1576(-)